MTAPRERSVREIAEEFTRWDDRFTNLTIEVKAPELGRLARFAVEMAEAAKKSRRPAILQSDEQDKLERLVLQGGW